MAGSSCSLPMHSIPCRALKPTAQLLLSLQPPQSGAALTVEMRRRLPGLWGACRVTRDQVLFPCDFADVLQCGFCRQRERDHNPSISRLKQKPCKEIWGLFKRLYVHMRVLGMLGMQTDVNGEGGQISLWAQMLRSPGAGQEHPQGHHCLEADSFRTFLFSTSSFPVQLLLLGDSSVAF